METGGSDFTIDYTEYHEVRWCSMAAARELIVDLANKQALKAIEAYTSQTSIS